MPEITPDNARSIAVTGLARLERPLRGYRFAQDVLGLTSAAAMFLTMFVAWATRTRPAFVVEAPTFGAGKTMLVEHLLYTAGATDRPGTGPPPYPRQTAELVRFAPCTYRVPPKQRLERHHQAHGGAIRQGRDLVA